MDGDAPGQGRGMRDEGGDDASAFFIVENKFHNEALNIDVSMLGAKCAFFSRKTRELEAALLHDCYRGH
jgi:hypothetical protein